MSDRFPILMYHGVSGATLTSITPEVFEWQMASLHRAGIRVLRLREAVEYLRRKGPLPPRSLALTFDDGLRSVYDAARPILARYGFPATVFLVTNYVGRDSGWPGQPPQVRHEPMLSWPQVRELDRGGLEFGAHGADHVRLDLLDREAARSQITDSKTALEARIGHEVGLFAYPYGRHSPAIRQIAGELFAGACTARPGFVEQGMDLLLLDRIDVTYITSPFLFTRLFSRLFPFYVAARRVMRGAGTQLLRRAWA